MKRQTWFLYGLGAGLLVLFLAGCGATLNPIEQRIRLDPVFFAALPQDAQERLRSGRLEIGDTMDAARIVYGEPTRTHERVTETSTNMVWSYRTMEMQPIDQLETVYYPISGRRGVTRWATDFQMQRSYLYDHSEYLRIEFRERKVIALDFIRPRE